MRAELARQGFRIFPVGKPSDEWSMEADTYKEGFPCRFDWRILWHAEGGKITKITGRFEDTCV